MGRLFWKFFFAFWLALLTASVGVGTAVWLHRQSREDRDHILAGGPLTQFLVNATTATLRHGGVKALRTLLEEWNRQGDARVYVIDDTGRELLDRAVSPETLAQANRLAREHRESHIARLETVNRQQYLFFIPFEPESLPPPPPGHQPPSPLVLIMIGIAASFGFSTLLAWYLAMPIRHLRGAFNAVASGKFETQVEPRMGRRRDEIADLGRDFDRMAQQLQILINSQQRLLHDVSHELRSPLARLQAAIGLVRQQPERLNASLDRIERESSRLDELVGELLTLSRLEAGVSGAPNEEVDLVELIRDVVEDAHFEAGAYGRQVSFCGEGQFVVKARVELLHRALENVIRNAVKHTREGTAVEVQVARLETHDCLVVTVADWGPGIPESDLQTVFEPFFRSETDSTTTGFGLGLAIAQRAITLHGGHIQALNRDVGGLCMEIILPISTPACATSFSHYLPL
ncbi:MAG: HAMP domain-containing protein [Candidatus Competibacteraceae bacterium]|nr:HAMP domain-containing protein [Candidatus Competibacteraceae bacterium]